MMFVAPALVAGIEFAVPTLLLFRPRWGVLLALVRRGVYHIAHHEMVRRYIAHHYVWRATKWCTILKRTIIYSAPYMVRHYMIHHCIILYILVAHH